MRCRDRVVLARGTILLAFLLATDVHATESITLTLQSLAENLLPGTKVHVSATAEHRWIRMQRMRNRKSGEIRTFDVLMQRSVAEGYFDWSFTMPRDGRVQKVREVFVFPAKAYTASRADHAEILVRLTFSVSLLGRTGERATERTSVLELPILLQRESPSAIDRCVKVSRDERTPFEIAMLHNCADLMPSQMDAPSRKLQ